MRCCPLQDAPGTTLHWRRIHVTGNIVKRRNVPLQTEPNTPGVVHQQVHTFTVLSTAPENKRPLETASAVTLP